jgi:hypothetical protein
MRNERNRAVTDDLVERLEELARISPISGYAPLVREAIAKLSAQVPRLPDGYSVKADSATAGIYAPDGVPIVWSSWASREYDFAVAFLPTPDQGHDSSAPLEPVKAAEDTAGAVLIAADRQYLLRRLKWIEERLDCAWDDIETTIERLTKRLHEQNEELDAAYKLIRIWKFAATEAPASPPDHRDESGSRVKPEGSA